MLFNVEHTEFPISGWLVPDNPGAVGALIVVIDGRERRTLQASILRSDIQNLGFHLTGYCGFRITPDMLGDVGPDSDLEIFDAGTNLLMFRRPPKGGSKARVLHLETQTSPAFNLAAHIMPSVQMVYTGAEMIAEQTLSNLFNLIYESIVISGSLLLSNYEAALTTREWRRSILLTHPYRELAARLLRLKALGAIQASGWRTLGQAELVAHFADVDLTSSSALKRAFRRMSDESFSMLGDPTTRMLVSKFRGEPLQPQIFPPALGRLAEFDLIGVDDRLDGFLDGLDNLLGIEPSTREPPPENPQLEEVVAALDNCRAAEDFVVLDMGLYEQARGAVDRVYQTVVEPIRPAEAAPADSQAGPPG